MSRERLMAQQRARMEARRARNAAKKLKKPRSAYDNYFANQQGKPKGVTRDTSKDYHKKPLVTAPKTKTTKPKTTGKPVTSTSTVTPTRRPNSVQKPKPKTVAQQVKPADKVPAKKPLTNNEKAKRNFFQSSSGTRGDYLPSNPQLKSQNRKQTGKQLIAAEVAKAAGNPPTRRGKPKNPKKGQVYTTFTGQKMVYNGKKWVQKRV